MVSPASPLPPVRSLQYRDLDALEHLWIHGKAQVHPEPHPPRDLAWIQRWYWPLTAMHWFPHPWQWVNHIYVVDGNGARRSLQGIIQVSPFNHSRSTWRVHQVLAQSGGGSEGTIALGDEVGSHLLRHCLEHIWEARTWIADVDVNDQDHLALYRHNGFQPLAQITRWSLEPHLLKTLADRDSNLPNLLPVSNADAYLLYQLDTVSMPPLLRQVFDRHVTDFQSSLLDALIQQGLNCYSPYVTVNRYVFEPQRKAAIGFFSVSLCKNGSQPHRAKLTVHPAYTFLYPQLLTQMAQLTQTYPPQCLRLKSADYQPEREEFLEKIQADRQGHGLLLSRSVWHKLREQRGVSLESLQWSEVLQGLQPSQNPIPGRLVRHWSQPTPEQPSQTPPRP